MTKRRTSMDDASDLNNIPDKRRSIENSILDACKLTPPRFLSILSDDLTQPIPLEQAIVIQVPSKKDLSSIMSELSSILPLPIRLQHLKRVRQLQVILVPVRTLIEELDRENSTFWTFLLNSSSSECVQDKTMYLDMLTTSSSIRCKHQYRTALEYIKFKSVSQTVQSLFVNPNTGEEYQNLIVEVAEIQPILRWQFEIVTQKWPCKFHPNSNMEKQYNNTMFNADELKSHVHNMSIVQYVRKQSDNNDCGMAVDPNTKRIIAQGIGQICVHPLMHSPMVLIDAVARSQGAGAWNDFARCRRSSSPLKSRTLVGSNADDAAAVSLCLAGVDEEWRLCVQDAFEGVKFGAQIADATTTRGALGSANCDDSVSALNSAPSGPYLCTGYDVYLTREPCIMCAMALVHSRVRTVFYEQSHANGALGSLTKVHTCKALNHHYNVYRLIR